MKIRILVVDDEQKVRDKIIRLIKKSHLYECDFKEAQDGHEALMYLLEGSFHIVLTDLDMPKMGGGELIEEIRGRWLLKDIPVIVITAVDYSQKYLKKGFDSFVDKSDMERCLVREVRNFIWKQ